MVSVTTPLLDAEDVPAVSTARDACGSAWKETKLLWGIGAPLAFNTLCLYAISSMTQVFSGRLGNLPLAAASIGLSVFGTFSFGFLLGMGSALETLCGQAFGAGQVAMLGVYLQRSWIILFFAALIMVPFYMFARPILLLLGQDETVVAEAADFILYIIPHLFALAINFPTGKFLQAQSKVAVLTWIGFVGLLFHVLMLYLFIYVFGWGLVGAAVAYDLSWWLVTIAQVVYIVGWCKEGWRGLSWAAFRGLWDFVKLSVASAVMLCLEIWYMALLTVLTGRLDDAQLALDSISICVNISAWVGMIFIGLNAAVGVRVSNELGSGRPRAARYAVIVAVLEALVIGLLAMAVVLVARDKVGVIFTEDEALLHAVSKIAGLLALTMLLSSIQPVISGVAVGGGWQGLVAYINLGCYYLFGLPLGYLFGFAFNIGVQGIWAGMLCGTALQTLILLLIIWRTDWKAEATQALARVGMWGGQDASKPLVEDH